MTTSALEALEAETAAEAPAGGIAATSLVYLDPWAGRQPGQRPIRG